ncbi:MAG: thymidylate kinase [Patescibacteria group bacterium]|nr:thymidylate kinase [Patescibacteria group bacterium]MDE2144534.1 thymidylate kinase [Patescibacteria group bacterium]
MHSNPLIVVEGADGAGKATQVKLLKEEFVALGFCVSVFSFPRYDHLYGSLIRRGLNGEFGDFLGLNPYVASALWAADRAGARDELLDGLKKGIVICDRYIQSNLAYQGAKLEGKARAEFIRFTEEAEYGELGLPKPNLVVYLAVPVSVSSRLSGARGKQDQHEANIRYQEEVSNVYRELAKERLDWKIVECVREGRLRDPDDIHQEVVKLALSVLADQHRALS